MIYVLNVLIPGLLVHAEDQSMEDHILRFFDLYVYLVSIISFTKLTIPLIRSYEYGPCIGVTRLQRWERAEALGLDPPQVVNINFFFDENVHTECIYALLGQTALDK